MFVGRTTTAALVVVSILWIPFIRYLNSEIYQYLQSVQAALAAPITATFLAGILWRGTTARAAIVTLIGGGVLGGVRFTLDVLHNGFGYDLGALNGLVEYSFLNFCVWVFLASVVTLVVVSRAGKPPTVEEIRDLTVDWNAPARVNRTDLVLTLIVGVAIVGLWVYFA